VFQELINDEMTVLAAAEGNEIDDRFSDGETNALKSTLISATDGSCLILTSENITRALIVWKRKLCESKWLMMKAA
jgi:hypothetical protein